MEWQKYIDAIIILPIPFLAKFLDLPLFFKDWKNTYVVIASIAGSALYGAVKFYDPNLIFLHLKYWWVFLILFFILLLIYLLIFIPTNKDNPSKNILILGLGLFVIIFCSLVLTFSLFFQSLDWKLVKCKVVTEETPHKPIQDATVFFHYSADSSDNCSDNEEFGQTDSNGCIEKYIPEDRLKKICLFDITHSDYENKYDQKITFRNRSILKEIRLRK